MKLNPDIAEMQAEREKEYQEEQKEAWELDEDIKTTSSYLVLDKFPDLSMDV